MYDCYARLQGNPKIDKYFSEKPAVGRADPHILFSKEEHRANTEEMFAYQAKERDFVHEFDRQSYLRLARQDVTKRDLKAP